MPITVDETTDLDALVGRTFRTDTFEDPFTLLSADQVPALTAIGYTARDVSLGYPFIAFLPWGKALIEIS
jgi:hypothetical protein